MQCLRAFKGQAPPLPLGFAGQALIELAVLGTILIFCLGFLIHYGLMANQSQKMRMKAFTETLKMAQIGADTFRQATTLFVDTKPVIDASNPFGIFDWTFYSGAGSLVCSNSLLHDIVFNEYDHLPRQRYCINGKIYDFFTAGFKSVSIDFSDDDAWHYYTVRIRAKEGPGKDWGWAEIGFRDYVETEKGGYTVKDCPTCDTYEIHIDSCFEDADKYMYVLKYDIDGDGEKDRVTLVDFDHDDKEELILFINGVHSDSDTMSIGYMDYQEGHLDMDEVSKRKQGLKLDDYTYRTTINKASIKRTENAVSGFETKDALDTVTDFGTTKTNVSGIKELNLGYLPIKCNKMSGAMAQYIIDQRKPGDYVELEGPMDADWVIPTLYVSTSMKRTKEFSWKTKYEDFIKK